MSLNREYPTAIKRNPLREICRRHYLLIAIKSNPLRGILRRSFLLIILASYLAPLSLHAQDTNRIILRVNGQHFFFDDEYFGRRIEGYTLPGFRLTPKVIWEVGDRLTLQGGISWLHYWGAHSYPATMSYGVLPDHSDTATMMHVVPWMQATLKLAKGLELTFGSLDATSHYLPMPLYNIERECAADPEQGLQLTAWDDWGHVDAWVDWREFIWNNSPRQERLTMGASGELLIGSGDWTFGVPLHFIAQHVGGQVLATTTPIQNNFNAASGLIIRRDWDNWAAVVRCRAMWYHQHGNPTVPFTQGWGLYPELEICRGINAGLILSYWQGDHFVPLMGSWVYSSLSSVDYTTVFDRTQILSLRAIYKWTPKQMPFCLHLEGAGHYDIGERQTQVSVCGVLSFYPSIRLR